MTPERAKANYRHWLKETIHIRRYAAPGSSPLSYQDYAARARVTGYEPQELVGSIMQGDRKAIVYADDLSANGLTLPVTLKDKLIVRGKELAVMAADDSTRRVNDVSIALELRVRG